MIRPTTITDQWLAKLHTEFCRVSREYASFHAFLKAKGWKFSRSLKTWVLG